MIYPRDFEIRLGFDQVRQKMNGYCLGELGRKKISDLHFLSEVGFIHPLLFQNLEAKQILDRGEELPLAVYDDPDIWFQTASIDGNFLEGEDFLKIAQALQIIQATKDFLQKNNAQYPNLFHLVPAGNQSKTIADAIHRKIDDEGRERQRVT